MIKKFFLIVLVLILGGLSMFSGCTPNRRYIREIIKAMEEDDYERFVELLNQRRSLELAPYVLGIDRFNMPPLHHACSLGKMKYVVKLVEAGADVNNTNYFPWETPIMIALQFAGETRFDIVKYLIDCGADVKLKKGAYSALEYVFTARFEETEEEQFNFALFLISKGADINNSSQGNLIFRAARYNNTLMVNYLINERGVDINLTCDNGYSALMYAARNQCYNVAKYLIENGARQDIVGKDGKTAKDIAIERGNEEIIALFN